MTDPRPTEPTPFLPFLPYLSLAARERLAARAAKAGLTEEQWVTQRVEKLLKW